MKNEKKIWVTQKLHISLRNLKVTYYDKKHHTRILLSQFAGNCLGLFNQAGFDGAMVNEK